MNGLKSGWMLDAALALMSGIVALSWITTVGANDKDGLSITVHGNNLSAHVGGAQLEAVLYQLSYKAGIRIDFPYQDGESRLWASFENLPLREAVRKLLKGHNYILVYDCEASIPAEKDLMIAPYLKILASLEMADREPNSDGELTKSFESSQMPDPDQIVIYKDNPGLHDSDPLIRVASVQGLANSQGDAALPFALTLINDPDARVQLQVLDLIDERGWSGNIPIDMLERLSLQGNHAEVRIRTLQLLSTRGADTEIAREVLELAAGDRDPAVRGIAVELLAGRGSLDASGKAPPPQ
jgi:hypothetical protein